MNFNFDQISTPELIESLENGNSILIDVRSADAYNGWKLNDEKRSGHIQGAKSLPYKWINYIDWIEIVRSKGIKPEHEVIIYGADIKEIEKVAYRFSGSGYDKIKVYTAFINEWTTNIDLPMDFLPRYKNLVHPDWVKQRIGEGITDKKIVICHAHYRNRNAYLSGHIPGAIDLDTLELESPDDWNRRSPEELRRALLRHGITSNTTVVLYGKYLMPDNNDEFPGSAAGHIGAMRCAFIMLYAGVKDVRILNGGFQSWKDAGYDIVTDDVKKRQLLKFGLSVPARPHLAVDLIEAKAMLESETAELVCTRSLPEYLGEVSGYNYIDKKGRIPGAIFGNCGSDAYHMENYRNLDHTIREYQEVRDNWEEVGITPDKHLAFYCGTGWRGSEAFINAWLMGWPNVSVFDGGWMEWSNDPKNEIETGDPAKKITSVA